MHITVVAEYHDAPAEGINVISKTLINDLRQAGHEVCVVDPHRLLRSLPALLSKRAEPVIFTHGPGPRTVLATWILRQFSSRRLIWIATRPDLAHCPNWLRNRHTAHAVLCNRRRPDLLSVAADARVIVQPIGIDPSRLRGTGAYPWPDLVQRNVPIALHVGHLRQNRGLERLAEVKARMGEKIEVIVVASPYFDVDNAVSTMLETASVRIYRGHIPEMADVYRAADIYLFPVPPEEEGAVELPLSVLEALACGRPVVTTRFGALPGVLSGERRVCFADGPGFADTVYSALEHGARGPFAGLPDHLHAHRLTERVIAYLQETQ